MNDYYACTALSGAEGPRFIAAGAGFAHWISECTEPEMIEAAKGGCWYAAASHGGDWMLAGDEVLLMRHGIQTRSRPLSSSVLCLCSWKDMWLGGTENGQLFATRDGQRYDVHQSGCGGRILAICASPALCLAVAENGWLFTTSDGIRWTERDFNREYAGYLSACSFTAAAWCGGKFLLAGKSGGQGILLTSTGGGLWSTYPLEAHDELGRIRPQGSEALTAVCWSEQVRQAFIATDSGLMYILPSCPKCVKVTQVFLDNVVCAAESGGSLLLAGAHGQYLLLRTHSRRQTRMDPQQGHEAQAGGALLIDLRREADASADPLSGAVNVPMEELLSRLPVLASPDQTILFVCDYGTLAGDAVELAAQLGYYHTFNVGSAYAWKRAEVRCVNGQNGTIRQTTARR